MRNTRGRKVFSAFACLLLSAISLAEGSFYIVYGEATVKAGENKPQVAKFLGFVSQDPLVDENNKPVKDKSYFYYYIDNKIYRDNDDGFWTDNKVHGNSESNNIISWSKKRILPKQDVISYIKSMVEDKNFSITNGNESNEENKFAEIKLNLVQNDIVDLAKNIHLIFDEYYISKIIVENTIEAGDATPVTPGERELPTGQKTTSDALEKIADTICIFMQSLDSRLDLSLNKIDKVFNYLIFLIALIFFCLAISLTLFIVKMLIKNRNLQNVPKKSVDVNKLDEFFEKLKMVHLFSNIRKDNIDDAIALAQKVCPVIQDTLGEMESIKGFINIKENPELKQWALDVNRVLNCYFHRDPALIRPKMLKRLLELIASIQNGYPEFIQKCKEYMNNSNSIDKSNRSPEQISDIEGTLILYSSLMRIMSQIDEITSRNGFDSVFEIEYFFKVLSDFGFQRSADGILQQLKATGQHIKILAVKKHEGKPFGPEVSRNLLFTGPFHALGQKVQQLETDQQFLKGIIERLGCSDDHKEIDQRISEIQRQSKYLDEIKEICGIQNSIPAIDTVTYFTHQMETIQRDFQQYLDPRQLGQPGTPQVSLEGYLSLIGRELNSGRKAQDDLHQKEEELSEVSQKIIRIEQNLLFTGKDSVILSKSLADKLKNAYSLFSDSSDPSIITPIEYADIIFQNIESLSKELRASLPRTHRIFLDQLVKESIEFSRQSRDLSLEFLRESGYRESALDDSEQVHAIYDLVQRERQSPVRAFRWALVGALFCLHRARSELNQNQRPELLEILSLDQIQISITEVLHLLGEHQPEDLWNLVVKGQFSNGSLHQLLRAHLLLEAFFSERAEFAYLVEGMRAASHAVRTALIPFGVRFLKVDLLGDPPPEDIAEVAGPVERALSEVKEIRDVVQRELEKSRVGFLVDVDKIPRRSGDQLSKGKVKIVHPGQWRGGIES